MIIVEGPDNAGKSRACERLASILHLDVVHSGGPADGLELMQRFDHAIRFPGRIYDRLSLISECVYKIALKRPQQIGEGLIFDKLTTQLLPRDPIIIYCRPPRDWMLNSKHEPRDGEDPSHIAAVEASLGRIINEYDRMMARLARTGFRVIHYDWTNEAHEAVFQEVIEGCAG